MKLQHSIFIGYRREDSGDACSRIHDALKLAFRDREIFMDIASIPGGADFRGVVRSVLPQCRVFLAMIGPQWTSAANGKGARRLHDANDLVRIEIETALETSEVRIIPVLINGASMPKADELPQSLLPITDLNAVKVRREDFAEDMRRLIGAIKGSSLDPRGRLGRDDHPAHVMKARESALAGGLVADRAFSLVHTVNAASIATTFMVIPPGRFMMGSPKADRHWHSDRYWSDYDGREGPAHMVDIGYAFALGKNPVTFAEWDFALSAGAPLVRPSDEGWGRGDRPVINVSWHDAQAYVAWLNGTTLGGDASEMSPFRLPSETEWEYACRAGTTSPFHFGDAIEGKWERFSSRSAPVQVNCTVDLSGVVGAFKEKRQTTAVGSFPPNKFGLHDMHGNVEEWCEDAWHLDYEDAPNDGAVWPGGDEARRVCRGGYFGVGPVWVRSACRGHADPSARDNRHGFRLVRDL